MPTRTSEYPQTEKPRAMTTLIVKITDGTDIRRFTANVADLTFESVQKRTAEAFGLGVKDLKLQYKDDEGDMVTMSSNDEMLEAIGLATSMVPAVLRLNVSKTTNNPKTTNTTTDTTTNTGGGAPPHDMNDLMQKISAQLPHLVHQLPEALRHLVPNAELDLAATVAANVNSAMTGGCHPGVTCDKTGMHPIVGNRWHLKGHDYDLCEAEYQKLAEEEKLKYELIPPPCAPPLAAGFGMGGCAGMGGMGGGRPTPADHGAVDEGGIHPGVSCDKSGMNPIVGFRYHLRGHNYDLCDAEYQKLPPKEQACFEKIAPPPKPKPFGGGGGGGFGGPAAWGTHGGGWGGRCGGGGGPKLAARFVRDVSIFDGTQMAPGTSFTKIWRIKNVGEVPWPPGTKIVFVGGDRMTSELTVPLSYHGAVAPGGEVDVAVDLVAPSELGRFVGYWRLTGPFGRRKFGQRVWCHIQVVDPHAPPAPPTELEIKNAMAIGTDDDDFADVATDIEVECALLSEDRIVAIWIRRLMSGRSYAGQEFEVDFFSDAKFDAADFAALVPSEEVPAKRSRLVQRSAVPPRAFCSARGVPVGIQAEVKLKFCAASRTCCVVADW